MRSVVSIEIETRITYCSLFYPAPVCPSNKTNALVVSVLCVRYRLIVMQILNCDNSYMCVFHGYFVHQRSSQIVFNNARYFYGKIYILIHNFYLHGSDNKCQYLIFLN